MLETKIPTYWIGNHDIFEIVLGSNSFSISCFPEYKGGVLSMFQNIATIGINFFQGD